MHYVLKLQQGRTLLLKWKPPPGHGCPLCCFSRVRVRKAGSRDRWLAPHANSATYQCGHLEGITPTPGLSFFSCKRGTARRKQATADLSTLKVPGFPAFAITLSPPNTCDMVWGEESQVSFIWTTAKHPIVWHCNMVLSSTEIMLKNYVHVGH